MMLDACELIAEQGKDLVKLARKRRSLTNQIAEIDEQIEWIVTEIPKLCSDVAKTLSGGAS